MIYFDINKCSLRNSIESPVSHLKQVVNDEISRNELIKAILAKRTSYEGSPQHKVGKLAQGFVIDFFKSEGMTVFVPPKSEKGFDFTIDGQKFEVKCQVPFKQKNSFSISTEEIEKISKVDFLVFVSHSLTHNSGEVYIIESSKFLVDAIIFTTKSIGDRLTYPINDMKPLFTLSSEQLQKLGLPKE